MKVRNLVVAVAGVSMLTTGAFAALSKSKAEWGNGPAKWLMTPEEQTAWSALKSDQEADDFVKLFWARRDPTPGTERNENREGFDARVSFADKNFASRKVKGSLTDPGMVYILVGPPMKISKSGDSAFGDNQSGAGLDTESGSAAGGGWATTMGRNSPTMTFLYEKEAIPRFAPGADFVVTFTDKNASRDYKVEPVSGRISTKELVDKGRSAYITRPTLTLADLKKPGKTETVSIPAPVIATPAAPATAFKNESLASAVTSYKGAAKSPYSGVYATYGEYVTATGEYFVPVQLYFAPSAGAKVDTPVTFFGQIEDESGKVVAVYEESGKLSGSKNDVFYDRSLTLPSGKYTGYFGAADESGKVLGIAKAPMTLNSIDKSAAGTSNLILTTNLYALPKAQLANDPFAFGGLKVVPKGDRVFSKATDELDYFIELRNPGIDAATNKPNFTAKITITDEKGSKMTGAPSAADVQEVKGVAGHYWIGSGYPLDSFKPGKYTMDIQLTDKVSGAKYDLKENFTIVEK